MWWKGLRFRRAFKCMTLASLVIYAITIGIGVLAPVTALVVALSRSLRAEVRWAHQLDTRGVLLSESSLLMAFR